VHDVRATPLVGPRGRRPHQPGHRCELAPLPSSWPSHRTGESVVFGWRVLGVQVSDVTSLIVAVLSLTGGAHQCGARSGPLRTRILSPKPCVRGSLASEGGSPTTSRTRSGRVSSTLTWSHQPGLSMDSSLTRASLSHVPLQMALEPTLKPLNVVRFVARRHDVLLKKGATGQYPRGVHGERAPRRQGPSRHVGDLDPRRCPPRRPNTV
jgi:hypothetical protein